MAEWLAVGAVIGQEPQSMPRAWERAFPRCRDEIVSEQRGFQGQGGWAVPPKGWWPAWRRKRGCSWEEVKFRGLGAEGCIHL